MRWLLAILFLFGQETEKLRLPEDEFPRRRARLDERLPDGPIVVDAGPILGVDGGGNAPMFDFKYLAGFHELDAILVIHKQKATAFVADPAKVKAGVDSVMEASRFGEWAREHLKSENRIFTRLRKKNLDALKAAAPDAELESASLGREITRMRLLKSEAELKLMKKAADATNKAHVAAMKALKPGMNEKEIQKVVEATFKDEGCPELGFPSICGAGKNGTVLHYMKNEQEIPAGTLMVCDIGAAIDNYVTDITRTLPTSGKYSDEQRKHYQCVLDAQKAAEAELKPGSTFGKLEAAARKVFADRGLTKWSYAHSKDGSVRHGLGHYVGMYVHDSGSYRDAFEPGMVITIEPGWYDKDAGYGIRIEDTYLVTKEGFERLSAGAPREIDEIEKLMAGKKTY